MTTFDDFWRVYPKRKGPNPKHPASLKFSTAVKNGADPKHLISSAERYAEELTKQRKAGSEFVCMAVTWLNQKRWLDYAPDDGKKWEETQAKMLKLGWKWTGERWVKLTDEKLNPPEGPSLSG